MLNLQEQFLGFYSPLGGDVGWLPTKSLRAKERPITPFPPVPASNKPLGVSLFRVFAQIPLHKERPLMIAAV